MPHLQIQKNRRQARKSVQANFFKESRCDRLLRRINLGRRKLWMRSTSYQKSVFLSKELKSSIKQGFNCLRVTQVVSALVKEWGIKSRVWVQRPAPKRWTLCRNQMPSLDLTPPECSAKKRLSQTRSCNRSSSLNLVAQLIGRNFSLRGKYKT